MSNVAGRAALLAPLTLFALVAPPAHAHHGWAGYDIDRPVTLTGTVIASAWENPHGTLRLAVDDHVWLVTLAPPHRMQNRGLAPDDLRTGAKVTVTGSPRRTAAFELRAERITIDSRATELR